MASFGAETIGGTLTQIVVMACAFQLLFRRDDQTVKVTKELLHQHEQQRRQEMAMLQVMAMQLEMEKSSQEVPEFPGGSLLLLACQQRWFWVYVKILLMLFGFYWLSKEGSSAYDSSAYRETPAVPGKKRRRRRKTMYAISGYSDQLDQGSSPDLCLQFKDM